MENDTFKFDEEDIFNFDYPIDNKMRDMEDIDRLILEHTMEELITNGKIRPVDAIAAMNMGVGQVLADRYDELSYMQRHYGAPAPEFDQYISTAIDSSTRVKLAIFTKVNSEGGSKEWLG